MIEGAFAYIFNSNKDKKRLLAYSHKNHPEKPLLVPGGSIKNNEKPLNALKREIKEESGLTEIYDIKKLGEADVISEIADESVHGHFYKCKTDHDLTEWEHEVRGQDIDHGLIFKFHWLEPQKGLLIHDYYFHVYMRPEYLPDFFTKDSLLGLSNKKISLMPQTDLWKENFEKEKHELKKRIDKAEIEHVGSTAVPWIPAKPIIDIAMCVDYPDNIIDDIEKCGYEYMGEKGVKDRYYFVKGSEDNRTHHIHLFEDGHQKYKDHILFRDYLKDHKDLAEKYGKLKLQLWRKYRGKRKKYTEAKSDFIKSILDQAGNGIKDNIR